MECQQQQEFESFEHLLNGIDLNNISTPALRDPFEISKQFNNGIKFISARNILYLNVLGEAKKLNVNNTYAIKRVTEILWSRATFEEKRIWCDLAKQVSNFIKSESMFPPNILRVRKFDSN
ncbi:9610_t:CDS:1 [Acaulospora morrowiae]|uniref:9610_t:CDS:1 n=1 Tax=Acaulospora morrowiae TaxID=94023 RepID=A0A9N8YQL6_9GLOM|nr:9610_t:CDS:1 [Acaulospora morrowiae]